MKFDIQLSGPTLRSVVPGWPSSSVSWWREGKVLDTSWEEISPGKSRNTMKLEQLSREDMDSRLECRGNNNNHTKPVLTSIAIDMNCEWSLSVEMMRVFVSSPDLRWFDL